MTTFPKLREECLPSYDAAMSKVLEHAQRNAAESRLTRARLLELQAETLRLSQEAVRLDSLIYRERCGLPNCAACHDGVTP